MGNRRLISKSNEITAIPKLLDLLDVKGCLITIDAMGCQKKILDKEADYLLAVKGNPGMLEQAFDDYFRMDMLQDFDGSSCSTQEKSHGRIETRVASIRQESAVATEQDVRIRYYICSKELEAQTLLEATRSHWGVEVMHWSLDTAFCEDNSRIRADDRA